MVPFTFVGVGSTGIRQDSEHAECEIVRGAMEGQGAQCEEEVKVGCW